MAAIVGVQRYWMDMEASQFFFFCYLVKYIPVAASPSVDALFDVAHQQALAARSQFLEEEFLEVLPLHSAGVLKLVYHHMVDVGAYLLEDEWRIVSLHHLAEQGWS